MGYRVILLIVVLALLAGCQMESTSVLDRTVQGTPIQVRQKLKHPDQTGFVCFKGHPSREGQELCVRPETVIAVKPYENPGSYWDCAPIACTTLDFQR